MWAVTGGNPYETVELLAKVQDSELEPGEGSAAELRALNRSARGRGLVARLEGLGIDATRFAWAAAILGTGISLDVAAQLAGMQDDEAQRCAELLGAARILTRTEPVNGQVPDGDLEFVHPLIATAVYRSIPDALRTAMHGQAAWAVTESGRGSAAASAISSKSTRTTTPSSSSRCARPPANTSPSAPPTRPGAAWSGHWPSPRCPRSTPSCSTNWAAPRS